MAHNTNFRVTNVSIFSKPNCLKLLQKFILILLIFNQSTKNLKPFSLLENFLDVNKPLREFAFGIDSLPITGLPLDAKNFIESFIKDEYACNKANYDFSISDEEYENIE